MAYLQRAAAASIQDQSDARAVVPIMATLPEHLIQFIDQLKPINFWSELSAEIAPMKDRAIARLASMAEIPGEVLTGIGDANHWTAWLISEEGIRWIQGYLGLIADALTRGFLRLALAKMGVPNPERFAFMFDTSTLAARPNRLEEALQLHDRQLLSDVETVKAGAFDPEQMPSVQERAQQILLKVVMAQPELLLDPAVQSALGLPTITHVSAAPALPPGAGDGEPEGDEPPADGPPNGGAAPDAPSDAGAETRALTDALSARIDRMALAPPSPERVFNAAAKLTVLRALELAGGRLATPAERRGRWSEVPRHELHHWVGPVTPDKARKVTEGAWNHVPALAADLGVDPVELHALLEGYVFELLTRGVRHHDDLLYAALSIAHQGRGLVAA